MQTFNVDCGAAAEHVNDRRTPALEIPSSNFPKHDRNPNTGADPLYAAEFRIVKQIVYHTPEYVSRSVIPVLP